MDQFLAEAFVAAITAGFFATLLAYPIQQLIRRSILPYIHGSLAARAKAKGKTVISKYIGNAPGELDDLCDEDNGTLLYQYTYRGRKYYYHVSEENGVSGTLVLYFFRFPSLADTLDNIGKRATSLRIVFWIIYLIAVIISGFVVSGRLSL